MNDVLWRMEQQAITALMVIDLLTAFGTVDHQVLIEVLGTNLESVKLPQNGTKPTCIQEASAESKNFKNVLETSNMGG